MVPAIENLCGKYKYIMDKIPDDIKSIESVETLNRVCEEIEEVLDGVKGDNKHIDFSVICYETIKDTPYSASYMPETITVRCVENGHRSKKMSFNKGEVAESFISLYSSAFYRYLGSVKGDLRTYIVVHYPRLFIGHTNITETGATMFIDEMFGADIDLDEIEKKVKAIIEGENTEIVLGVCYFDGHSIKLTKRSIIDAPDALELVANTIATLDEKMISKLKIFSVSERKTKMFIAKFWLYKIFCENKEKYKELVFDKELSRILEEFAKGEMPTSICIDGLFGCARASFLKKRDDGHLTGIVMMAQDDDKDRPIKMAMKYKVDDMIIRNFGDE